MAETYGSGARVSVLGSTEVDGQRLTERQRPLVATLALHRARPVPTDLLLEAVWPAHAPETARQSLQNQVTRLRRRFGAALIETAPGGYRLAATTDVDVFDRLLGSRMDGTVQADDAAAIDSALQTWRGVPYVDLLDLPEAEPERARLERLRNHAHERLALARIVAGDLSRAVAELEALTREDPLCERRWELLMAALHLDGRRGDALAVFDRAAEHLVAELGVDPSPHLASLRDRIASGSAVVLAEVGDAGVAPVHGPCGLAVRHRARCARGARR